MISAAIFIGLQARRVISRIVHNDFTSLEFAPIYFQYTPVKFKSPFVDAWQDNPFSLEEALEVNLIYIIGVGLLLGEVSGGILAVDLDGVEA